MDVGSSNLSQFGITDGLTQVQEWNAAAPGFDQICAAGKALR
jgi:hypothetical protein